MFGKVRESFANSERGGVLPLGDVRISLSSFGKLCENPCGMHAEI